MDTAQISLKSPNSKNFFYFIGNFYKKNPVPILLILGVIVSISFALALLNFTNTFKAEAADGSNYELLLKISPLADMEDTSEQIELLGGNILKKSESSEMLIVDIKSTFSAFSLLNSPGIELVLPLSSTEKESKIPKTVKEVKEKISSSNQSNVVVSFIDPVPIHAQKEIRAFTVEHIGDEVLKSLSKDNFELKNKFKYTPAISGIVNENGLKILENNPLVESIRLVKQTRATSLESVPLVKADIAHAAPYELTGKGITVAVIDTGVDTDHPDFTNDNAIIDQKCFTSDILDDQGQLISASDCEGTNPYEGDIAEDRNGHGTSVAGIITEPDGFAPDSKIVPVRVANNEGIGSTVDWNNAFNWIIDNQEDLSVDIINISMEMRNPDGTGLFFNDHTSCQNEFPALYNTVQQLHGLGIIIFAGTGNSGSTNGISAPACLSNVIAVGATYDSNLGREPDEGTFYDPYPGSGHVDSRWADCYDNLSFNTTTSQPYVTCFSNVSTSLGNIIMAPGARLTSTGLGGGQSEYSGTSQATPAAAGVGALLLQLDRSLTTSEITSILQTTGTSVYTSQNSEFKLVEAEQAILGAIPVKCQNVSDMPLVECTALQRLYENTDGANWTDNTGWNQLSPGTACDWQGISCAGGHVSNISMTTNNVTGDLPEELQNLKQLSFLNLGGNNLSGEIPVQLTNLSNLAYIYMYSNNLTGEIPGSISNLGALRRINLSTNSLTGTIPQAITDINGMELLYLANNKLSGTIPAIDIPADFPNLTWLNLSNNQLSGTISSNIGNLGNLGSLFLSNNQFDGEVPDSICNNLNYTQLNLDYNTLLDSNSSCLTHTSWKSTQTIAPSGLNATSPTANSIDLSWTPIEYTLHGGYYQIEYRISGNPIWHNTITIDKTDSAATVNSLLPDVNYYFRIRTFTPSHSGQQNDLLSNPSASVQGTTSSSSDCTSILEIPESECRALESLHLDPDKSNWAAGTNWMSDSYPCGWDGVTCFAGHIIGLDLNQNYSYFGGSIPPELSYLSELEVLLLDRNDLTGTIPEELGQLSNLKTLSLYYNQISGNLPDELGNLSSLEYLYLQGNLLDGSIPASLSALTNLKELKIGISLSGQIPAELGDLHNLETLELSGSLTGTIPPELGNLTQLISLKLPNNQLSGQIPVELSGLVSLSVLDLSGNGLTGSFPGELGSLSSLTKLNLENNQLSGAIPPQIGNLTSLKYLYLDNNQFTSIPDEIGNLLSLTELEIRYNSLTGGIPSTINNLSSLFYLHLSDNLLSSSLPATFGNGMSSLSWLNLRNNHIVGNIPSGIGEMYSLRTLDLSNNRFSGPLPAEMDNLSSLKLMYLQNNALNGEIPSTASLCNTLVEGDVNYNMFEDISCTQANLFGYPAPYKTQTYPPFDLKAGVTVPGTVEVSFEPIYYQSDGGFYSVSYSFDQGGPYDYFGCTTNDKTENSCLITEELDLGLTHYFAVQSYTPAHGEQQNDLLSAFSGEVWEPFTNPELVVGPQPYIEVLDPGSIGQNEGEAADREFTIKWSDIDLDDDAQIDLYFDDDNVGEDGFIIDGPISEDSPIDEYTWDLLPVPPGNYYVYAVINDGSDQYTDYSEGYIIVNHDASNFCLNVNEIPQSECDALVSLYYATNGYNWNDNSNWLWDFFPCGWAGIVCNGSNVIIIELPLNNLSGYLPSEIGNLTYLEVLQLNSNSIAGSIPSEIGNLLNLQQLILQGNSLSHIPAEIGNLSSLEILALDYNQFSSTIPEEIGYLSNLNYLALSHNSFRGDIPYSLIYLTNLTNLKLESNKLTGNFPVELAEISTLTSLNVSNNQMGGMIPVEICGMGVTADLSYNMFSGPSECANIDPDWELTQTVPPTDLTFPNLALSCDPNDAYKCNVEVTFTPIQYQGDGGFYRLGARLNPFSDYEFNYYGCSTISKTQNSCTLTNVEAGSTYYFVSQTFTPNHGDQQNDLWSDYYPDSTLEPVTFTLELTPPIIEILEPDGTGDTADSRYTITWDDWDQDNDAQISLYYDTDSSGQDGTLIVSQISEGDETDRYIWDTSALTPGDYYIYGVIDDGTYPVAVDYSSGPVTVGAHFSCNGVNGIPVEECEALVALYASTNGHEWNDSTGWFQNNTPCGIWYGIICSNGHVVYIGIANNNMTGGIPPEIENLTSLSVLNLYNNKIKDPIPPEIGNLSNLTELVLYTNEIGGSIPSEIGNMASLTRLVLGINKLTGRIPGTITNLNNLEDIILSDNMIDGSIPLGLWGMSSLKWVYLDNNQLTGQIPTGLWDSTLLTEIDLSNNKLTGAIPRVNVNSTLNHLYLQNNYLRGVIPSDLCSLSNLTITDFGYNIFSSSDPCIDTLDPDWKTTQTVPPSNVKITSLQLDNRFIVEWDPIIYQADTGHYQVSFSETQGGPYNYLACQTSDKTENTCTTVRLEPDVPYYFIVQTITLPHGNQQSELWSGYSEEKKAIITPDVTSLITQINDANTTGEPTSIYLYPNFYYSLEQINNEENGENGLPTITGDITIVGSGAIIEREVIKENIPGMRLFNINPAAKLTLTNIKVKNGAIKQEKGGAIRNEGTLVLDNATLSQNIAHSGGAVYNLGQATVTNSKIEYNMAFGPGGGIESTAGSMLTISGSTFEANISGSGGGAINNLGILSLDNTQVKSNLAASGGGLSNGGEATLSGLDLKENTTIDPNLTYESQIGLCDHEDPYKGGGICNYGELFIYGSIIQANSSAGAGGGIYNDSNAGNATINSSCIVSNASKSYDAIANDSVSVLDAQSNWWGYTTVPTPAGIIGGNVNVEDYLFTPILGCPTGMLHDEVASVKPLNSLPYEDNEQIDTALQPLPAQFIPSCGTGIAKGIYYQITDDDELVGNIIGRARVGGVIGRARIGGSIGRSRIGGVIGRARVGGTIGKDKYRFNITGEDFDPVIATFVEDSQGVLQEESCKTGLNNLVDLDVSLDPGVNHYMVIGFKNFDDGSLEFKSESLNNPLPVEVTGYYLSEVPGSPDEYYVNLEVLNVRDYNLNNINFRLYVDEEDPVYDSPDKASVVSGNAAISSLSQGATGSIDNQISIMFTGNYVQGDTVKFYLEISEDVTTGSYTRTVVSTLPLIIPQKLKFEFWDFDDEQEISELPQFPPTSDPRYMDDELTGLEEYAVRWVEDIDFPFNEYYSITHDKGGELSEQFYDRMAGKLSGLFNADSPGTYRFYITVEDGAELLIDGNTVIDSTGTGIRKMEDGRIFGSISLTPGWHEIEILYFDDLGGNGLKLEYKSPFMISPELVPPELFMNNVKPAIQITEPDGSGDLAEDTFTIQWIDSDPDDDANISLYYDSDKTGEDGTLIASGLSEDNTNNSYIWDTSAIPEASYYIYVIINDAINLPQTTYGNYPLLVNRQGICPASLCNGDFESTPDLDYWTSGNGTNQIVTNVVQDGTKAYYTEHIYDSGQNPRWSGIWQTIMVESAQTYGLTGFYQSENAAQGHIKISWKDTSGTLLQVDYPVINMSGTNSNWIEFSKLVIAPAGAFTAELRIWHGVNTSSQNVLGSKLWIDSLAFEVATTACGTLCNESFEHGILYWIQSGAVGSHTIEQTGVHEGLKTLKSEQLYTPSDETKWAGVTQYAQVKEGTTYRFRSWFKTANATNGHVRIRWRNDGGSLLSTQYPIGGIGGTTSTWFSRQVNVTAPVNAARAEIAIWHGVTTENITGSTLWIDDITMICLTLCNGGFEDGNVHWETNGINEGEIVLTDVQEGSQALKIVQNLDDTYNTQWAGVSQRTLVTGGNSYNLSFWMKKENAAQGHVKIKWRDANDQLISQQFPIGGINGTNLTWTQMSTTLNAPANAETVEIFIWHGVNGTDNATGSTLYLDNLILTEIP